ncbi:MAG: hypothetical protein E7099_07310 [Mediterranea massiliensis]|nr:hypothetical protein [Mediterranea massiliensis]
MKLLYYLHARSSKAALFGERRQGMKSLSASPESEFITIQKLPTKKKSIEANREARLTPPNFSIKKRNRLRCAA